LLGGRRRITDEEYDELYDALNEERNRYMEAVRRLAVALDILASSDLLQRYNEEVKEMEE